MAVGGPKLSLASCAIPAHDLVMRRSALLALALAMLASIPAQAADPAVGRYRAAAGPDTAAELELGADGKFEFGLAEGALDERAQGRWTRHGDTLTLETLPKPVPPVFRQAPRSAPAPKAPTLLVTTPDGHGIAGVDFRIGFDTGGPLEDYTQESGWTMPEEEHRVPRWIELVEPIYHVVSPRYAIAPGAGTLHYVIVPNDIGVVDFSGTTVDVLPGGLLLHRDQMRMEFVRDDATTGNTDASAPTPAAPPN